MKTLIYLILVTICSSLFAQEINEIILDEDSNKPILIGKCNREAFQDSNFKPWFEEEYDLYQPSYNNKEELKQKLSEYKITIVMGTWCSDSRREVPSFYKILDELEYPEENILLINVDRSKQLPDGEIKSLNIEFVPTIIIFKDSIEIGRIIEVPETTLERDLEKILGVTNPSR